MCQKVNLFLKKQFKMLVVFPSIFVADTKLRDGYNFVAPLSSNYLTSLEVFIATFVWDMAVYG